MTLRKIQRNFVRFSPRLVRSIITPRQPSISAHATARDAAAPWCAGAGAGGCQSTSARRLHPTSTGDSAAMGRKPAKDRTCVALNKDVRIYRMCEPCSTHGHDLFTRKEAAGRGIVCDRLGKEPERRTGDTSESGSGSDESSGSGSDGDGEPALAASAGSQRQRSRRATRTPAAHDAGFVRDQRRNPQRPRGKDAGRRAASSASDLGGGQGKVGLGAVALGRISLSGSAATPNVLAGRGGMRGAVSDHTPHQRSKLGGDLAPALAGTAALFAPDDCAAAVVAGAAAVQQQRAREAAAEPDLEERKRKLAGVADDLSLAAATAKVQSNVLSLGKRRPKGGRKKPRKQQSGSAAHAAEGEGQLTRRATADAAHKEATAGLVADPLVRLAISDGVIKGLRDIAPLQRALRFGCGSVCEARSWWQARQQGSRDRGVGSGGKVLLFEMLQIMWP